MSKYKINTNREKLSEQEITQHMNFNKFMSGYAAKAGWFAKGVKLYSLIGASAVAVVAGGYLIYQSTVVSPSSNGKKSFVAPPIEQANVDCIIYTIDTKADTVLIYENGSRIHIPASAFLDENGNPVSGDVELRYREFHDPADIFLSGIPMTYDSAGEQFHFESAGMMEMGAFKGGKPLYVNPNAMINVDLISHTDDDRFNVYYLDTVNRKWNYIAEDHAVACDYDQRPKTNQLNATSSIETNVNENTEIVEKPELPKRAAPGSRLFSIDYEKNEFPELAVYDGVKFEVINSDENFKPEYAQKIWEDVVIKRVPDENKYEVTFSSEKESHTFSAQPVIEGKDYAKALTLYEIKMKQYTEVLNLRMTEQRKAQHAADSVFAARNKIVGDYNMNARYTSFLANNMVEYDQMAFRTFNIAKFGIWNSDCPARLPSGPPVFAQFYDRDMHKLNFKEVYLIAKGKNIVYTYNSYGFKNFRFNPKSENMVWGVTTENKMALVSVDEFERTNVKSDTIKFKMEVIQHPIKTSAELRMLLKI